jgi:hypothetical protein
MKRSFLVIISFFFLLNSYAQSKLKWETYVNNKLFTENRTLDTDDIITLKLVGTNSHYEYSFDKVMIELITKTPKKAKQIKNQKDAARYQMQTQEERVKYGKKQNDLKVFVDGYDKFSKNPSITIPYSLFKIDCLSRIIIQVKKVKKKINKTVEKVDTDEFDYQKEVSFFAHWDCKN